MCQSIEGKWIVNDPHEDYFCDAPENSQQSAHTLAAILTRVQKRLQANAIQVQDAINKAERKDYEGQCAADSDRATFDAWKQENNIESDSEIWDVEVNEQMGWADAQGDDVYKVTDDLFVKLPNLAEATRTVKYLTA
jgi:hypothetical protein